MQIPMKDSIMLLTLLGLAPSLVIMALGLFGIGFCFAILLIPQLVILLVTFDVVVIISLVFTSSNALALSFAFSFAFSFALSFALSFSISLSTLQTLFVNALISVRHGQLESNDTFDILHWSWHGNLSLLKVMLGCQDSIGSDGGGGRGIILALTMESTTCSNCWKVSESSQRQNRQV
jgi:hypothetical protein